jgi:hypothetical protein
MKNNISRELKVTLENLDKLLAQLRETKDYSKQAETVYFLKELILEQTGDDRFDEDTHYSAHQTR